MNIHRLKTDAPTASYIHAARTVTDYPLTIVSDRAGVQIQTSGENWLSVFPVEEYKPGKFVVGDSKRSTGRGCLVRVGDIQDLDHAVSVCDNRALRLVKLNNAV